MKKNKYQEPAIRLELNNFNEFINVFFCDVRNIKGVQKLSSNLESSSKHKFLNVQVDLLMAATDDNPEIDDERITGAYIKALKARFNYGFIKIGKDLVQYRQNKGGYEFHFWGEAVEKACEFFSEATKQREEIREIQNENLTDQIGRMIGMLPSDIGEQVYEKCLKACEVFQGLNMGDEMDQNALCFMVRQVKAIVKMCKAIEEIAGPQAIPLIRDTINDWIEGNDYMDLEGETKSLEYSASFGAEEVEKSGRANGKKQKPSAYIEKGSLVQ